MRGRYRPVPLRRVKSREGLLRDCYHFATAIQLGLGIDDVPSRIQIHRIRPFLCTHSLNKDLLSKNSRSHERFVILIVLSAITCRRESSQNRLSLSFLDRSPPKVFFSIRSFAASSKETRTNRLSVANARGNGEESRD